ncbi:MAG: hypothetical protein O3C21_11595 [Verrucomicrobia bacterium]|nr:hypothetical protein [Verrucomicrobiota bacterium]
MKSSETAEEHLRAIRALMERSTIYRAISAPAALMGGILGIVAGAVLWWVGGHRYPSGGESGWLPFVLTWLMGYLVVEAINFTMIYRNARHRGDRFLSPGLRHAVRALAPPLLCGCVTGVSLAAFLNDLGLCAIVWVIFFGLALLSTGSFAPKSLVWLGRAFAFAGIVMLPVYLGFANETTNRFQYAALIMAVTFGLFHLIYAAAITGAQAMRPTHAQVPSVLPSVPAGRPANNPFRSAS